MKNATLLIERSPGETRTALLYGKEVWQVDHFRDNQKLLLGGIYNGRIRRIDQTTNSAFVDIGEKSKKKITNGVLMRIFVAAPRNLSRFPR